MIDYERAVPDLERAPSHPGADGRVVYCLGRSGQCQKALGILSGGYFHTRHHGRELTSPLPAWVRCERCGCRQKVGA